MIDVIFRTLITAFFLGLAWALTPGVYDSTQSDTSGVGAVIALWAFFLALVVITWTAKP